MDTTQDISRDLRRARTRKGYSQAKLARLIYEAFRKEGEGVSVQAIKDIEARRTLTPQLRTLEKIAHILPELSRYIPR